MILPCPDNPEGVVSAPAPVPTPRQRGPASGWEQPSAQLVLLPISPFAGATQPRLPEYAAKGKTIQYFLAEFPDGGAGFLIQEAGRIAIIPEIPSIGNSK